MKKFVLPLLTALSLPAFADPTVFKMELGKTTEQEVKEMYTLTQVVLIVIVMVINTILIVKRLILRI